MTTLRSLGMMPVREPQPRRQRQLRLVRAPLDSTRAGLVSGGTIYFVKMKGAMNSEGVTDKYIRGHGMGVTGIFPTYVPSGHKAGPLRYVAEPYVPDMVMRSRRLADTRGLYLAVCRCWRLRVIDRHQMSEMRAAAMVLGLPIASNDERHADRRFLNRDP